VDRGSSQLFDHWSCWCEKIISGLRPDTESEPGGSHSSLCSRPRAPPGSHPSGSSRHGNLLSDIAKTDVLAPDDFKLGRLAAEQRYDLLEMGEDCYTLLSALVTTQLSVKPSHQISGDPTLTPAIQDCWGNDAHAMKSEGESMKNY
jgi:hypothetical protein